MRQVKNTRVWIMYRKYCTSLFVIRYPYHNLRWRLRRWLNDCFGFDSSFLHDELSSYFKFSMFICSRSKMWRYIISQSRLRGQASLYVCMNVLKVCVYSKSSLPGDVIVILEPLFSTLTWRLSRSCCVCGTKYIITMAHSFFVDPSIPMPVADASPMLVTVLLHARGNHYITTITIMCVRQLPQKILMSFVRAMWNWSLGK